MRYLNYFFISLSLSFSSFASANTEVSRVLINCTLNISGPSGRNKVIDNLRNDIFLGHTNDPNGLQNVFAISESHPEIKSMARSAVYGRAFKKSNNKSGVLIGFYRAQIRHGNSLSEGVIQHEALSDWQFTPVFIFEYELDHTTGALSPVEVMEYTSYGDFEYQVMDASLVNENHTDIHLNGRDASRFTGVTYLNEVDLSCFGYPTL